MSKKDDDLVRRFLVVKKRLTNSLNKLIFECVSINDDEVGCFGGYISNLFECSTDEAYDSLDDLKENFPEYFV